MRQHWGMMQTCPKCGFVQPEDKYCANCGLDIESFKPAPTPFFKRIFGNTAVQIGIVVLIVIAVTIAILLSQKSQVERRLHSNFSQVPIVVKSPGDETNKATRLNRESQNSRFVVRAPSPTTKPSQYEKLKMNRTRHRKIGDIAPEKMLIGFYEMSRASIMEMATEGQVLSATPQSRSMTLPLSHPFLDWREKHPNSRPLGSVINESLHQGRPINLDFTRPLPPNSGTNEIGATFSLNPIKVNAQEIELGLELAFNMRNHSGNSLITNEVNSTFTFSPKSTLVLSGYFPHERVFRQDLMSFSGTPLAILASPDFINSVTDLVIVIKTK